MPAPPRPTLGVAGRIALGAAVALVGGEGLVRTDFVPELFPVPHAVPVRAALACGLGVALVVAGLGIALDRGARIAGRVVAVALWAAVLAVHLPRLVAQPRDGGAWTCAFEVLAIGAGAAAIGWPERPDLGRWLYGAALPAFGVLHFLYRDYVAFVIPAWIPAHLWWAYATGVAHLAAGAALLTGVRARLAAVLAGAMFASWVVILHLPRAIAAATNRAEWNSLFVALAMAGGAWAIAARRR